MPRPLSDGFRTELEASRSGEILVIFATMLMMNCSSHGTQDLFPTLLKTDFKQSLGKVSYHVPCHLRVQNIGLKTRDVLKLVPDTTVDVIERCVAEGVNPGYALGGDYPEHEDGLLVALTEKRTRADIDRLAEVLGGAVAAERTRGWAGAVSPGVH